MEKRYDDMLTARLEAVLDAGAAHVLWNELYRWYATRKIAVGTYRDLVERWSQLKEAKNGHSSGELKCVDGPDGLWLFSDNTLRSIKDIANKEA